MTDLEFVKNPDNWPMWPLCPLVRKGALTDRAGYLVDSTVRGPHTDATVYIGYIYDAKPDVDKQVKYTSLEEMLCEWRVD